MNNADLKTQLLCSGVCLPEEMRTGRKGGAGPAGGRYIVMGNTVVNAPIYGNALESPFSVKKEDDTLVLSTGDTIRIVEDPHFYTLTTEEGISYKKIALLHGTSCLATTVVQTCIRWRRIPCSFCGIELSLQYGTTIERKTPQQLLEVAEAAQKEGVTHVTLTTGTPNEKDKGALILAESASSVKKTGLPVHVQLEPVERKYLEILRNSGADTVGIHVETLDESVFRSVCPLKDFSQFEHTWRDALSIFGENQVSSYVLVGLGEKRHRMISGIEKMVQMGVIPYVVPFRPLPGTVLEKRGFPPFDTVKEYSVLAAEKMKECGVNPFKNKAGCIRCGACSSVKDYLMTL